MLRQLLKNALDRIDPPKRGAARICPSCGVSLTDRDIVEQGDVDYCLCARCGSASIWSNTTLIVGYESVILPDDYD